MNAQDLQKQFGFMHNNELLKFFEHAPHRLMHKWLHYFHVYEKYLARYKNTRCSLLEFGVSHGGSLQMWKHFLGPQATIVGVDIDPRCAEFKEEQIDVIIADQADKSSINKIKESYPKFDIVIDDGGHDMVHQINTLQEFLLYTSDDGVYICEDTHSSYMKTHGGGYKQPNTFLEFTKNIVDQMHAHHSESGEFWPNTFTTCIQSVHYYDSMVVIERRPPIANGPQHRMFGQPSWELNNTEKTFLHGSAMLPKITRA